MGMEPFRLTPFFSERVWGRASLAPWYAETGTPELVGEAWLTGPQCVVETGPRSGWTLAEVAKQTGAELLGEGGDGEFPLLVKILFPNDKLSVQVHPDDAQARAMGQARGKTECWYVLDAEPGAAVALGLREGADAAGVERAIAEGTLEEMLVQVPVRAGEMVFVDAGTVHAIGPGVTLLETQQTSDTTFRMCDYGRPRELHVEQGIRATRFKTRAGKVTPRVLGEGCTRLIEERYFTVDRFEVEGGEVRLEMPGAGCLVGLEGSCVVANGAGEVELRKGTAVVVPAGSEVVVKSEGRVSCARCFAPRG